jgi:hypothetical protein
MVYLHDKKLTLDPFALFSSTDTAEAKPFKSQVPPAAPKLAFPFRSHQSDALKLRATTFALRIYRPETRESIVSASHDR